MSTGPLVVLTRLRVQPGKMDEALAAISANVAGSAGEPGVVRMALHREEGDDRLAIVEVFAQPAALDEHRRQSHFTAVVAALPELLDGPPESITLDHLPTDDSPKDRIH